MPSGIRNGYEFPHILPIHHQLTELLPFDTLQIPSGCRRHSPPWAPPRQPPFPSESPRCHPEAQFNSQFGTSFGLKGHSSFGFEIKKLLKKGKFGHVTRSK